MKLFEKISRLEKHIGQTHTSSLEFPYGNLYAKLEFGNFMGSIKDRAAFYVMKKAIEDGKIDQNTTIIESSSGNLAMGLGGICKCLGLKFIAVVDPKITREKEKNLSYLATEIVKVHDMDDTGGYLLTRIAKVKELVSLIPNSYNLNQYSNTDNYMSYYNSLGNEINDTFDRLNYLFVSVSTGGTVTGLSMRLREKFPDLKVIAVDIEGSLALGGEPKKRNISGLGSSRASEFIPKIKLDHTMILTEKEIVKGCEELFHEQMIFAGGSSGAAYYAAKRFLARESRRDDNSLIICPDRGHAYIDIIYTNNKIKADEISGY